MDLPFFSLLEGLSPWWWVAFGIGLGALEMATMSFFLIWPGLAAIVMAVLLVLAPGMPGEVQVAAFAALSVALTFGGRALIRRYGDFGEAETNLNARSAQMVGRRGTLLRLAGAEATVEIDGVHWRAALEPRGDRPEEGAAVEVTGVAGMTLEVRAAPED